MAKKPKKAKNNKKADLPKDPADLYITTAKKVSIRELAELYDLSASHLRHIAAKEKWTARRKKYQKTLEEKKTENIAEAAAFEGLKTLAVLNNEHSDTINQLKKLNAQLIMQNTCLEIGPDGKETLVVKMKAYELRTIQRNVLELIGYERLIHNYPRLDPIKEQAGDTIDKPLSEVDLEILEAWKNEQSDTNPK